MKCAVFCKANFLLVFDIYGYAAILEIMELILTQLQVEQSGDVPMLSKWQHLLKLQI